MRRFLSCFLLIGLVASATGQDSKLTRFEKSIDAFEAKDKKTPPPRDPIVFTGSSSIARWKELGQHFPEFPVMNRGFGGSTLPEVNHYLDRVVLAYHPKIVVLFCGGNDLAAKRTPEQVRDDFVTIADRIQKKLPDTKLYYLSIHTPPGRVKLEAELRKANELIKEVCERPKNRRFVDIRDTMLGKDGQPNKELYVDPLHPTTSAYESWAARLTPILREDYRTSVLDKK
jgi:lysophospholipase L1-like esterase